MPNNSSTPPDYWAQAERIAAYRRQHGHAYRRPTSESRPAPARAALGEAGLRAAIGAAITEAVRGLNASAQLATETIPPAGEPVVEADAGETPPAKPLHQMGIEEFHRHAAGVWAEFGHGCRSPIWNPPVPRTISQFLTDQRGHGLGR